ncbi:MAG TPA: 2-phospho-L-lactate guanylyltransferase [Streptosporangiaceae bacterium]|jgi:2-phospho-L-lactate guanylyltransferase
MDNWSLVVPVKPLDRAKSRIAAATGAHREKFALAIAADTITAALASPAVGRVVVVTDDLVAGGVLGELGAYVIADEPDAGLNPALLHGAAAALRLAPRTSVAALFADLPALRPEELTRALEAARPWRQAFVPDAADEGTTLYTARPGHGFSPSFGRGSRDRHRLRGAHEMRLPDIPGLRRDVDTLADLREAITLGVGRRTAEVAALFV